MNTRMQDVSHLVQLLGGGGGGGGGRARKPDAPHH